MAGGVVAEGGGLTSAARWVIQTMSSGMMFSSGPRYTSSGLPYRSTRRALTVSSVLRAVVRRSCQRGECRQASGWPRVRKRWQRQRWRSAVLQSRAAQSSEAGDFIQMGAAKTGATHNTGATTQSNNAE